MVRVLQGYNRSKSIIALTLFDTMKWGIAASAW